MKKWIVPTLLMQIVIWAGLYWMMGTWGLVLALAYYAAMVFWMQYEAGEGEKLKPFFIRMGERGGKKVG